MSIAIKFGSSPMQFHGLFNIPSEIWDIIYTYKINLEKKEEKEKKFKEQFFKELREECQWWWQEWNMLREEEEEETGKVREAMFNPMNITGPLIMGYMEFDVTYPYNQHETFLEKLRREEAIKKN